ncbi:MAG: DUF2158 domain-containing protein [Acidobacteria bacterium]|nr:MAG: DUF2158 domain-containing protein [Acidobacteriota bacterium]
MSDQITVGSVVQLKSGGPKMTVTKVESWNGVMRASCEWFDRNKSAKDFFPLGALKLVAEESSGPAILVGRPGIWS